MSHVGRGYDINQTFIVEPLDNEIPIFSACTALYSNFITSCSGNTNIFLGTGTINFDGNLYTNDDLSATTVYASTYYSGGTNLFDIINDLSIASGSFNNNTDTLTLTKQNGGQVIVTGFTDYYTTGTTIIGSTVYFNRNDQLSAYTLNLSQYSADTYVTGVTFNDNQLIIARNDGVNLNTFINTFTGLTVNGLFTAQSISATTISATTFYGDGSNLTGISTQDTFVTGGTYSNGTAVFTNNTGGTFSVSGFSDASQFTGGTVIGETIFTSGITAYTVSATTFYGDGSNLTGISTQDTFVTGGTYTDGVATFTNNTGGTFNVTGFYTGTTDIFVTGATYDSNTFIFTNNTGGTFSTSFDVVTGLTINGNLSVTGNTSLDGLTATTIYGNGSNISGINFAQLATTAHTHPISDVINLQNELNSKIDKPASPYLGDYLYYNGVTWVPNQVNIPVSAGASITLFLSVTGSTLMGYEFLSEFPIQVNEVQEPVVVNNSVQLIGKYATKQLNRTKIDAGIWEFNSFASVDIPSTGLTQIIVSAYLLTTGGSETFLFSGETENIASTAATLYTTAIVQQQFSCNTTDYLVIDYSGSTNNNFNTTVSLYHGGTVNYSHIYTPFTTLHNELTGLQGGLTNEYYHLSQNEVSLLTTNVDASSMHNHNSLYLGLGGGTVTGSTVFNSTLSATTYLGLPVDIRVTGGTYNPNTGDATFTNNSGGTFTVSGFLTGQTDTYVTGLTFNNNVLTLKQTNNQLDISTTIDSFSALTVNGVLSATTYLGLPILLSGSTLYSNTPQTSEFSTSNSIFLGENSGYQATNANNSNFLGQNSGNLATNANGSNFFGVSAGYQAINASYSNFFGQSAGYQATNANNSNFFGEGAGYQATYAYYSNFLGYQAGFEATDANYSNLFGRYAGYQAANAYNSNFLGENAGNLAINSNFSNFLGQGAGYQATNANNSNFLGLEAGYQATNAYHSNFFGEGAGYQASGASNSNFFGESVGKSFTGNDLGSNNIIIGTNITLPNATADAINIGGVLFGTGTYNTTTGNPSLTPTLNGKIGIGVVNPSERFHVSGNTLISGGLTATTISATTYLNLPIDVFVTGATKSGSVATFTNNTGGTFTLTGLTDTLVTGGTYNTSTSILTFTNNTGGTFTVTGITTSSAFTGGTVTGATNFTNGLTATTISATTLYGNGSNLTGIVASWSGLQVITVGENVSAGDLLYLSGDSKYYKASSVSEPFSSTELRLAVSAITANNTGSGLIQGQYTTSGLITGAKYWVGTTNGTYSNVQPSSNGSIVRYIGTALNSTTLEFNPDQTYIEISSESLTPVTGVTYPSIRIISTSQTALTNDYTIVCTTGLTLTIPTAVGVAGQIYVIKNTSTGTVTINTTSSQTIDGQVSGYWQLAQYDSLTLQSTNSNWIII